VSAESTNIAQLVTTRPDSEAAADFRRRIQEALAPILDIMNEAARENFVVGFNVGRDAVGRCVVTDVTVARHY